MASVFDKYKDYIPKEKQEGQSVKEQLYRNGDIDLSKSKLSKEDIYAIPLDAIKETADMMPSRTQLAFKKKEQESSMFGDAKKMAGELSRGEVSEQAQALGHGITSGFMPGLDLVPSVTFPGINAYIESRAQGKSFGESIKDAIDKGTDLDSIKEAIEFERGERDRLKEMYPGTFMAGNIGGMVSPGSLVNKLFGAAGQIMGKVIPSANIVSKAGRFVGEMGLGSGALEATERVAEEATKQFAEGKIEPISIMKEAYEGGKEGLKSGLMVGGGLAGLGAAAYIPYKLARGGMSGVAEGISGISKPGRKFYKENWRDIESAEIAPNVKGRFDDIKGAISKDIKPELHPEMIPDIQGGIKDITSKMDELSKIRDTALAKAESVGGRVDITDSLRAITDEVRGMMVKGGEKFKSPVHEQAAEKVLEEANRWVSVAKPEGNGRFSVSPQQMKDLNEGIRTVIKSSYENIATPGSQVQKITDPLLKKVAAAERQQLRDVVSQYAPEYNESMDKMHKIYQNKEIFADTFKNSVTNETDVVTGIAKLGQPKSLAERRAMKELAEETGSPRFKKVIESVEDQMARQKLLAETKDVLASVPNFSRSDVLEKIKFTPEQSKILNEYSTKIGNMTSEQMLKSVDKVQRVMKFQEMGGSTGKYPRTLEVRQLGNVASALVYGGSAAGGYWKGGATGAISGLVVGYLLMNKGPGAVKAYLRLASKIGGIPGKGILTKEFAKDKSMGDAIWKAIKIATSEAGKDTASKAIDMPPINVEGNRR